MQLLLCGLKTLSEIRIQGQYANNISICIIQQQELQFRLLHRLQVSPQLRNKMEKSCLSIKCSKDLHT